MVGASSEPYTPTHRTLKRSSSLQAQGHALSAGRWSTSCTNTAQIASSSRSSPQSLCRLAWTPWPSTTSSGRSKDLGALGESEKGGVANKLDTFCSNYYCWAGPNNLRGDWCVIRRPGENNLLVQKGERCDYDRWVCGSARRWNICQLNVMFSLSVVSFLLCMSHFMFSFVGASHIN